MNYRIEVSQPARNEIKSLAGYVRAQARELISGLAKNPHPPRAKELRDKPNIYRICLRLIGESPMKLTMGSSAFVSCECVEKRKWITKA